MIYKWIFPLLLVFSLSACDHKDGEKNTEAAHRDEENINGSTASQSLHHHHESEEVELNNGQKWKIDEKMIAYLRTMEKEVMEVENSSVKNYKYLAGKLQQNIGLLTSNCTMEGKAHDELHKWLVPFIDLTDRFSNTADPIMLKEQFSEIKISFETFNKYFE